MGALAETAVFAQWFHAGVADYARWRMGRAEGQTGGRRPAGVSTSSGPTAPVGIR